MSTNGNMQRGGRNQEIPLELISYQIETFLEQEERLAELATQVSMQLAAEPSEGMGPFRDNSLASAWYRMHPEELEDNLRSTDEVCGRLSLSVPTKVMNQHRVRTKSCSRHRGREVVHGRRNTSPDFHRQRPNLHLEPRYPKPLHLKSHHLKPHLHKSLHTERHYSRRNPAFHSFPMASGQEKSCRNNGTKQLKKLGLLR